MLYNWQQDYWPQFRFELAELQPSLFAFSEQSGRVNGLLSGLPEGLDQETLLNLMIEEAIRSSAIEGEFLSRQDVMSSIKNHLGLNSPAEKVKDLRAAGIGELMSHLRRDFDSPLTQATLFDWHALVMQGTDWVSSGAWRKGKEPMQVVSGRIDRPTIHFEAPASKQLPAEMKRFLKWFNASRNDGTTPLSYSPIRAGIAHLYFESIHPFEDGNGRLGRAISDKALAQGAGRFSVLSLSRAMEAKRNDYYDALKSAQRSNEITPWLHYFIDTVLQAQSQAEADISFVLKKTKFYDRHRDALNKRQQKVLAKMFDAGPERFEGGMNVKKYLALTKTSKATATRDLQHLVKLGALSQIGQARSTRYELDL